MATAALSYAGNLDALSGVLTGQSTVTDLMDNRVDILKHGFVKKVMDWPSMQRTGRTQHRSLFSPLSVSGEAQWSDEETLSPVYKKLVALVDSWGNVESIVSQIRFSQHIYHAERIAIRLNDLRCMAIEEGGDSEAISTESVRTFFSYLKMHPRLRYPDITLTPDGNVYSRWKGNNGALLGMEFLPDSKIAYVVFMPTPSHAGELSRHSGIDFADTVFGRINTAFSVSEWMME